MAIDPQRIRCSGKEGEDALVRAALNHAIDSLAKMPLAREEFLAGILALHDHEGTLRVFWRSNASRQRFRTVVDRAWAAHSAASPACEHYVGTKELPDLVP